LSWEQMGLSPKNMEIIEGKHSSARDVCLAFGVPPQLIGIPGDNTYANYQEARLAFWEDTVIPFVEYVGQEWSNWLGKGEVELRANMDKVPAIVEKRSRLWEMADGSTDLTINERRELKGYPPLEDVSNENGNVLPKPASPQQERDEQMLKSLAYGNG
jgi:HK97 family phage portal protein